VVSRTPPRKWSEQEEYEQPRKLWQNMSAEDQEMTAKNIAGHIQGAKETIIQRQLGVFRKCDESLAKKVDEMLAVKRKAQEPYTMVA
jgi:catalase